MSLLVAVTLREENEVERSGKSRKINHSSTC